LNDILSGQVLVLSKNFRIIGIIDVREAFKLVYAKKAVVLDENYNSFSLEECEASNEEEGQFVKTIDKIYKIPEIIRLTEFDRVIQKKIMVSRENVFFRDQYTCQYCNAFLTKKEITIDHIIPRSRQNEFKMTIDQINSWTNLVSCCQSCNVKKDDKTLEEAGLKLIKKPHAPFLVLKGFEYSKIKPIWKVYLNNLEIK